MTKMKRLFCLLIAMIFINSICIMGANSQDKEVPKCRAHTRQELAEYQKIIDKLNKEYDYDMSFDPKLFTTDHSYRSPLEFSLEEFEQLLRDDIAAIEKTRREAEEAIRALGDNVKWVSGTIEKSYKMPYKVSSKNYMSFGDIPDDISDDMFTCFRETELNRSTDSDSVYSIQSKLDDTEHVALWMYSNINVGTAWKYSSAIGFAYREIGGFPKYIPKSYQFSKIDTGRTMAVTYTCDYYNAAGTLTGSGVPVYREYSAASDCLYNSPNYTIPRTYTNQIYRPIENFSNAQNCAGYAWNYNDFVDRTDLGITWEQLGKCKNYDQLLTVVKNASEAFMANHGINAEEIAAYNSPINPSTQYRAVLRTGYFDDNGDGVWNIGPNVEDDSWDYHWWVQLGDGSWADK